MTDGDTYGLCLCGCGERTKISTYNFPERGWVKGEPRRFVKGHNGRMSVLEKFWPKILRTETCWLWTGTKDASGYGVLSHYRRNLLAHRVSYELARGPIPEGLHIDHLCCVRNCVNPDHLEAVTQAENNRRAVMVRIQRAKSGDAA